MSFNGLQKRLNQTISHARLEPRLIPGTEVKLHLLSDDYPRGPLPHEEMLAVLNEPAYWAFCWASGQVLARFVLEQRELFAGKTVVDFGAGSGAVGIAAALAGAARVICCDIDPAAIHACEANAELNDVEIELVEDINLLTKTVDWLIAADVLYDRDNFPWLDVLPKLAKDVLIADSRVKQDVLKGYEIIEKVEATTIPDLDEFKEYNTVRIYRTAR